MVSEFPLRITKFSFSLVSFPRGNKNRIEILQFLQRSQYDAGLGCFVMLSEVEA
jgi:hypothetical protein